MEQGCKIVVSSTLAGANGSTYRALHEVGTPHYISPLVKYEPISLGYLILTLLLSQRNSVTPWNEI